MDLVRRTNRRGIIAGGLIPDIEGYIENSALDNWSTLIEWTNPDYRP